MDNNSINRLYESVVRIEVNSILFQWDAPFIKSRSPTGSGSGFLIDDKGHILTCFHVVNQAVHIFVTLPYSEQQRVPAKIVAIYPEMDMAILKISKNSGRYLELGDSDSIKIGKKVLAIGYPLGQGKLKITKGIVSGLESGYIQTDAPINPGNSGGPLLYEGKVIGINTAKIVDVGTEGVGYANPINYFNKIRFKMIPEDKNEKSIIRIDQPSLGILTDKCSKQIMNYYDCNCPSGIQITKVFENSPLTTGNYPIKDGDILCSIGGYTIDNSGECKVPWNREKVSYNEVFDRISIDKNKMKITYYTIVKQEILDENGSIVPSKDSKESNVDLSNSEKNSNLENQNISLGGLLNLEKINLEYLLKSVSPITSPNKYYKYIGKLVEREIDIVSARKIFKIWNYFPPYDNIEYICFGGIVMMNLTMNHIMMKQYQHLFYNYINKLDKHVVLITKVLPSTVKIDNLLGSGDVLREVNNISVHTIKDVSEALKKPIFKINGKKNEQECYVTFKTELNKFYAIKLDKIVKEDIQLFQYFNYQPSEATKFYIKNISSFACLSEKESNNNSNSIFKLQ